MSDQLDKKNGELTEEDLEDKLSDKTMGEVSGGTGADPNSPENAMFNPKPDGKEHFFLDPKDGTFLNPKQREDGILFNPKSPEKH